VIGKDKEMATKEISYGIELVLDLKDCDPATFTRKAIKAYYIGLCNLIDMQREKLCFWDDRWVWLWKLIFFWDKSIQYANTPKTKGVSAVQFILTSNVTIHALADLKLVLVNIFSCKRFDLKGAEQFTIDWFGGEITGRSIIRRGVQKKRVRLQEIKTSTSSSSGRTTTSSGRKIGGRK
jgi:hypothetical protein